jgi:dihydrofolate synthase / folylpolyglutamate synthase
VDPFAYLYGLEQFGIKFGLENMSAIVERLGHPERAFTSVHIAGTNGKGSVTAMVDAALRAAGHRSARYTSPHLVDLTERFVIDGAAVPAAALGRIIDHVRGAVDELRREHVLQVQPTFFEVTTAVAFELFRRNAVEVAVLEVGLGGRLDATNVVSPAATAITSIGFDHQLYLGPTLADIASEKAGIVKPGVPLVVGELAPEPDAVVTRIATERGAPLIRASERDVSGLDVGLRGAHQRANAAVALHLLRVMDRSGMCVSADAAAHGIARPEWPGRLDLRRVPGGRELLLDAAHNPAGAAALASYLRERSAPLPLVFAAMRDKDIAGMMSILAPVVGRIVATRASHPRSADPNAIAERVKAIAPALVVSVEPNVTDALAVAWQSSPRIVVAGSIFLLGDVLRVIPFEKDQ